ncbi:hypothetical protein, partial [Kineosporia sp. A_224]|uniref:hypothetical protein n=1 Tax=Kineosporia sp. A_224 TaxID=1962180 RepID=UPI001304144D
PTEACAVTVGLHSLGLPELVLPARPENLDPGRAWRLSHRDLSSLLRDLGDALIGGDLWERDLLAELDTGVTAARLYPEFPAGLDLLVAVARTGRSPKAAAVASALRTLLPAQGRPEVTLVRWDLVDGPRVVDALVGSAAGHDPVPLAEELARVRARTAALRGEILERDGRPGRVPVRWRPNPRRAPHPSGEPQQQRFGPRHAVVVARAEQVLLSDVRLLKAFLTLAWDVADAAAGEVVGAIGALAGATGRGHVPAELELAAEDVTTLLTGRQGDAMRWQRAYLAQQHRVCVEHRATLERISRDRLLRHVHALLATEAFADSLPPATAARGRASWAGALEARPW